MKRITHVLAFGLLSSLISCSPSVIIQSNRKAEAQPEFSRILIESRLSQVGPTYLSSFQTSFPAGYQVCVVSNSVLSFESPEEAVEKQRLVCQSEVILTIDFKRNSVSASGEYAYSSNELYVEMKNLATGQPFWKAVVTTSGSVEVPAINIVNKLIDDGIIQARLPSNNPVQTTN